MIFLFIVYDLLMVKYISDRIGVMYLGCMMEIIESAVFYKELFYFYMKVFLFLILIFDLFFEDKCEWIILKGELLSLVNLLSGCVFRMWCFEVMEFCGKVMFEFEEVKMGCFVVCYLYKKES